jgi:acyl-coenzyme A synthetase/AMP-(fatty) acid ligase
MTTRSWWGADLLGARGDGQGHGNGHGPGRDHGHERDHDVWACARGPVTVGRLRAEVAGLAKTMSTHGIGAHNTVALQGAPSFTQLWCLFALWSLGAQVLLFDPRLGPGDRVALLRLSEPEFVVTFGRGMNCRAGVFADGCEVLVQRLAGGRPAGSTHCVVQFSSGTTGRPKAIGRTPESLLAELERWRALDGMPRAGERVTVLESFAHSFGLVGGLLCAMDAGATVVFPTAQTPRAIANAVADAHVVMGNPWHFGQLTGVDDGVRTPRLRLAVSGGDVLSRQVFDAFYRRFGVPIGQAYGTTETGIVAAHLAGDQGPTTIGLPVQGVRTRVADGELEVHVPQSPYLYESEHWPGGWISTGDLVSREAGAGVLRLRGRVEEAGRTNLDLLEIESVLRTHESVSDAVVFGAEPLEAHVESAADLHHTDLRSWCRRFLGESAAPARYRVVRELPRTANGKVRRIRRRPHEHQDNPHSMRFAGGADDARSASHICQ